MAGGIPVGPAARHFEEFEVGAEFRTQGRTVTDIEGMRWAMFTGDMNPMHVDNDFATKHGLFGGRFPPGLMVVAIASGLNERMGLFAGTGLAMLGQTIRYSKAVVPGDTVHVELTVRSLEPRPRRSAGIVEFGYEIVTGDGTVAIEGEWTILLASSSTTSETIETKEPRA